MELSDHALRWDPAPEAESARLGADGALLLDYQLHPPPGVPSAGHQAEALCRDRQCALQALIAAALA